MQNEQDWAPSKVVYSTRRKAFVANPERVSRGSRIAVDVLAPQYELLLEAHARGRLLDCGRGDVRYQPSGVFRSPCRTLGPGSAPAPSPTGQHPRSTPPPYTAAEESGTSTTWRGVAALPAVRADRVPCADTMSGEVFEASATATLEDRVLYGCGRFL